MKKLLIFMLLFVACNSNNNTSKHLISGTAAVGTYIPDGSAVELRAAPVKTGNQILVGYYPDESPDYRDETTPTEIRTATVSGGEGKYTVDVTGLSEPYIVRVYAGSKWYYSYADGVSDTANVNPYSDWMVRSYYTGINSESPGMIDIDSAFTSGILTISSNGVTYSYTKWSYGYDKTGCVWYGKSLPVPNIDQINRCMAQLQSIFMDRYSIDLGDVLTRDWVIGATYDSILDGSTIDWNYISDVLINSYYTDDAYNYFISYYYGAGNVHIEYWSKYPYSYLNTIPGVNEIVYSDVTDGVYHYVYDGSANGHTSKNIGVRICETEYTAPTPGCVLNIVAYTR